MEIPDIVNLIMNSGVTVFVLAYFIYRDKTFMTKLDNTLEVIKEFLKEKDEK